MGDFAPPTGPPPPKVPEGWKAVWNDQYKEWFYVNTYTKKSQWDRPTEPVYGPPGDRSPAGPPPSYDHSNSRPVGPDKGGPGSNNPYSGNTNDDEALARRLQAEEAARARGSSDRGAADSYYSNNSPNTSNNPYGTNPNLSSPQPGGPPYASSSSPAPPEKRGLFSKLTGGGTSPRPPSQGRGYGGYPPQQPGYGGYPPQGPPPGPQYGQPYGGGGYPGYYPPQQQQQAQYQQQQQPQQKHGLGAGGGALLGAGAGLLGGALLMDAFEDHSQAEYQQGFDNGEMADNGGYGGDDGGGDYGGDGGDFGGDF